MFWAGAVAIPKFLTRVSTAISELDGSNTSKTTGTGETLELSSVQRESSESDSNLSLPEWPSVKSPVTNSSFSEARSDEVTAEQQRKEEQNAMSLARDTSLVSEDIIQTKQWIQPTRGGLTTPIHTEGFWSNSNITVVTTMPQREGCSRAPDDPSTPGSKDTDS